MGKWALSQLTEVKCLYDEKQRERKREISQQSEQNSKTCQEMLQTFTNQFSILLSRYRNCFRVFSRSGSCLVQNKNHKKSMRSNKILNSSQQTICLLLITETSFCSSLCILSCCQFLSLTCEKRDYTQFILNSFVESWTQRRHSMKLPNK